MIFQVHHFMTLMGIMTLHAEQVYRYDVPVITVRAGNAWTINGNFKLIHAINLDEYTTIAANITTLVEKLMAPGNTKDVIIYRLTQVQDKLSELGNIRGRTRRSINWIGSAWKWVAGNPDASDWDAVLQSQNVIIHNNNEQYRINTQLFNTANEIVQKTNDLIAKMNEISSGKEADRMGQDTLNQVLILTDTVNEVVRACQLAIRGIVNTNLLNRAEIEDTITEIETLPYANAIEAIEFGSPSIYTNGSLLLYVLSVPKLKEDFYHRLIARTTIRMGKQIELPFNEILVSQNETFGVKSPCLSINQVTVCQPTSLVQLAEESCVPRLLKGGNANCRYKMTTGHVVEMITTDIIFLTNFKGVLTTKTRTEALNGSYLIQLYNESILIDNEVFSSTSISRLQPLPPVLTSVTSERLLVDIDQVHNISLHNTDKLQYLGSKLNLSIGSHLSLIVLMIICIGSLWYKLTKKLNLPAVKIPTSQPTRKICGTQTFEEGGVSTTIANSTVDAADTTNLAT